MRGATWALAALASLLAVPAAAQVPEPVVVFEDVVLTDPIEPLSTPGVGVVTVEFGCAVTELPVSTTHFVFETEAPAFATALITPSGVAVPTEPGDCPDPSTLRAVDVNAAVALSEHAPAFVETKVLVRATMLKEIAEGHTDETYGPYAANLTLTVGYFDLYDLRVEEKNKEAGPGDVIRFPITIDNLGNGDTRFTLGADAPEGMSVTFEPDQVVLQSRTTGGRVTSGVVNAIVRDAGGTFTVLVHSEYAHDPTYEGATSHVSLRADFGPIGVPGETPGIGAFAAMLVIAMAALLTRRRA